MFVDARVHAPINLVASLALSASVVAMCRFLSPLSVSESLRHVMVTDRVCSVARTQQVHSAVQASNQLADHCSQPHRATRQDLGPESLEHAFNGPDPPKSPRMFVHGMPEPCVGCDDGSDDSIVLMRMLLVLRQLFCSDRNVVVVLVCDGG